MSAKTEGALKGGLLGVFMGVAIDIVGNMFGDAPVMANREVFAGCAMAGSLIGGFVGDRQDRRECQEQNGKNKIRQAAP